MSQSTIDILVFVVGLIVGMLLSVYHNPLTGLAALIAILVTAQLLKRVFFKGINVEASNH